MVAGSPMPRVCIGVNGGVNKASMRHVRGNAGVDAYWPHNRRPCRLLFRGLVLEVMTNVSVDLIIRKNGVMSAGMQVSMMASMHTGVMEV